MHYHLEIVMPPAADVEAAITEILAPFQEGSFDDAGDPNTHTFWDYWSIGGRWSGEKILHALGNDALNRFSQELVKQQVAISGVQFGKPSLAFPHQRSMVDALWCEWFPDCPLKGCPLFDHYKGNHGDIMPLKDVARTITAHAVMFAAPGFFGEKRLHAVFMVRQKVWNGLNSERTAWDGTLGHALELAKEDAAFMSADYAEEIRPKDDWLCVTVDYHT